MTTTPSSEVVDVFTSISIHNIPLDRNGDIRYTLISEEKKPFEFAIVDSEALKTHDLNKLMGMVNGVISEVVYLEPGLQYNIILKSPTECKVTINLKEENMNKTPIHQNEQPVTTQQNQPPSSHKNHKNHKTLTNNVIPIGVVAVGATALLSYWLSSSKSEPLVLENKTDWWGAFPTQEH